VAPHEEGRAWEDWVVFDLSCDQDAAAVDCSFVLGRFKCFIDLEELSPDKELDAGIYVLIEPARDSTVLVEKTRSTLWEP
jgi:hypothetical protein